MYINYNLNNQASLRNKKLKSGLDGRHSLMSTYMSHLFLCFDCIILNIFAHIDR